ncbi:dihydrofolate reductase family protein [Paramicrobacterium fandaimingii]|uniref:dihydrofolate reductase family protein n=1 Tax=Paramicrobacterium fandaimingii TaxID=2708079 RepID=UPI00141E35F7|nr:dihydrofolate reductase family protein [Microbacterium fandaimingii]
MRTLAVTQNITLDGSIEMLDDWFNPTAEPDPAYQALNARQDQDADACLLGRQTFEDFRGFWPKHPDDTLGVSEYLNTVQKYVVSTTIVDPAWQNSTVLSADPIEQVRSLKQQPGKNIVCTGSIQLTHALISAGLVDEYRLFTYPVVQGRGRRLFPSDLQIPSLRLIESQSFRDGVVFAAYRHDQKDHQ